MLPTQAFPGCLKANTWGRFLFRWSSSYRWFCIGSSERASHPPSALGLRHLLGEFNSLVFIVLK